MYIIKVHTMKGSGYLLPNGYIGKEEAAKRYRLRIDAGKKVQQLYRQSDIISAWIISVETEECSMGTERKEG